MMKVLAEVFLTVFMIGAVMPLRAGDEGVALGALIGAGAGVLLERETDLSGDIAVPVMAALGAVVGDELEGGRYSQRRRTQTMTGAALGAGLGRLFGKHVRGVDENWAAALLALYGASAGSRHAQRREYYYVRPRESRTRQNPEPDAAVVRDLHPGIELLTVQIEFTGGLKIPVRLIKTGGRYIGPRGEVYDVLPEAAVLQERYGM